MQARRGRAGLHPPQARGRTAQGQAQVDGDQPADGLRHSALRRRRHLDRRALVEPEVYDYAATVQSRTERDDKRRQLLARLESGQTDLDLLKLPLYPYQVVGTLFLAFTERALLADDMGLGKTVEAMAAARLLMEQQGIRRVLIITPASVKRQWAREIARFVGLPATVVGGGPARRARQYADP